MALYEFERKLCRFALLLASICLAPSPTSAADHYICAGATGTGDGSGWTNAYPDLPASFVRGDTYWVAGGNYGPHAFSTATSGSLIITIKAATDANHGSTDAGWTTGGAGACHQGQAKFTPSTAGTPWSITTGYWTFDGSYRGTPWNNLSSYGFFVNNNNNGTPYDSAQAINVTNGGGHITFKYIAVQGSGLQNDQCLWIHANSSGTDSIYVGYSLFDHPGIQALRLASVQNVLIEYNWMQNNGASGGHSEMVAINEGGSPGNGQGPANANITYRYNYIENSIGAGNISTPCGCSAVGGTGFWDFYENVFFYDTAEYPSRWASSEGAWDAIWFGNGFILSGGTFRFVQNTISGAPNNNGAGISGISLQNGSTLIVENNLWFANLPSISVNSVATMWGYNSYFTQSFNDTTVGAQNGGNVNPFVNVNRSVAGAYDFNLTKNTAPGTPLGSAFDGTPYNRDQNGHVGSDRGAFQFAGATSTLPAPPTGLAATVH